MKLRFAEEIVLLLLSEDTGALDRFSNRSMNYVLAGATLMDLALENRIDNDQHHLILVDPTPLGDPLLDPTLEDIAQHPEETDLRDWVERISKRGDALRTTTLARLVKRGILESAEEGLLFLSSSVTRMRRYPTTGGDAEQEIRSRIMRLLFSDDIPDPRDIVVVCLVHACRLFENLLTRRELDEVQPRIELLTRMDLIGQALYDVIRKATKDSDEPWRGVAISKNIPEVKGLPIVGNALDLSRDLFGFLIKQYHEHGPIFRLKLFNQYLYVLAGPQANEFVARYGNLCLSSYFTWRGYNNELGTTRSVVSMDGPEHLHMRRALAYGYSRTIYEKQISKAIDILRDEINSWQVGATLPGYKTLQRTIIEQIGQISASYSPDGYYEDLVHFLDDIMITTVVRARPMFLYRRRLNKVGKRIEELCTKVLNAHLEQNEGGTDQERSLISDMLEIHRQDPLFLPASDLKALVLSPFLAGLDTVAGTCSFALYVLLKNPDLLARVQAEADELFANGKPNARDLRVADVIQRVGLETLRLYPVAPVIMRQVSNSFVFNGYRINSGEKVMVATTLPHFLPEYFPEPQKFDIDRYLPERAENKQKFVYAPFGLGPHRCLGSGFAGPQIASTIATIVRYVELALDPPNYKLKVQPIPTLRPKKDFKLKVVRRR